MAVRPNLDYARDSANFQWEQVHGELDWLPGGGLNMAHEAIDRHADGARRDKVAMIWEGRNGEHETYTFGRLKALTNRFANVLVSLGVGKGDRVFLLMDRLPELYITCFGALKVGAIVGPLFSALGPDPVRDCLQDSAAKVLVTQPHLRRRITGIIPELFDLQHIVVVNKNDRDPVPHEMSDLSYDEEMGKASPNFDIVATSQYDSSIMHYTSGTTGKPKGAVHRHRAIVQQHVTGKWVLDLHEDDVYWCTANPGWVTGTSYGMLAPWSNGVTQLIYEGGLRAGAWYEQIQKHKVTVWYTAPTAIRMLMKAGDEVPRRYNLSSLRHLSSVGEPLGPEAVVWGEATFGVPFHDNWWQTETGAILIANYPSMDIRPGSMGRPVPGIQVGILDGDFDPVPPGDDGNLAIRPGWPSRFQTYWDDAETYNSKFRNGWYITSDRARMDEDGYLWFVGRADDVINTAGHLVGPFEVETALFEHPAVADAAVIGKPDPVAMEIVKAFVVLKEEFEPTPELRDEITRFTRQKLSTGIAPREIEFVASLPRTRNGKVMRRLLKARELGLPEGDTGALEDD